MNTVAVINARLSMRGGRGQDRRAMERIGRKWLIRGLGDKEGGAPTTTSAGPAQGERSMNQGGREGLPKFKAKFITHDRDPVFNEGI